MFTGIIQSTGQIIKKTPKGITGAEMTIKTVPQIMSQLEIGDSISVSGVCSTITQISGQQFNVDYLEETLKKTTLGLSQENDIVNIELCATLQTKLGGHLVSGHVDEIGKITSFKKENEWGIIEVQYTKDNAPYLIPKGSITIDGISLTVVDIKPNTFTCHLIPHTIEHTTLANKTETMMVNLEYDQVGKYLHRFYSLTPPQKNAH